VRIDEPLMRDIAAATDGRYFRARDAQALAAIYDQIDPLEREPVRTRTYVRYAELFRWPLLFGLVALLAELALTARRGRLP
jgi:Ca-activated chloride channel family protein